MSPGKRLLAVPDNLFYAHYDYNGNTETMVNSSGTTTYAWDFENRSASSVRLLNHIVAVIGVDRRSVRRGFIDAPSARVVLEIEK